MCSGRISDIGCEFEGRLSNGWCINEFQERFRLAPEVILAFPNDVFFPASRPICNRAKHGVFLGRPLSFPKIRDYGLARRKPAKSVQRNRKNVAADVFTKRK